MKTKGTVVFDIIGTCFVHAWDIAGAARSGLRTAFITQEEKDYLSIYPQPELITSNLSEAANKILASAPVQ